MRFWRCFKEIFYFIFVLLEVLQFSGHFKASSTLSLKSENEGEKSIDDVLENIDFFLFQSWDLLEFLLFIVLWVYWCYRSHLLIGYCFSVCSAIVEYSLNLLSQKMIVNKMNLIISLSILKFMFKDLSVFVNFFFFFIFKILIFFRYFTTT